MFEITNIRQGAILNHNHGKEDDHGLTIAVEGICDVPSHINVNGVPAARDGRRFFADVTLKEKINTITATAVTTFGDFTQSMKVVWDKKSFKRCNFYIDDHSFFWTDLAKERPKRAFDHFYLAGLKKIHDKYGLKVTLNCFYRNDHHPCEMKEVPDIYKQEFIDNSDWLKLSVHSYSEFPDRPYVDAHEEDFARDYDLIRDEIIRFAGEESFIAPVVIHWGNISPGTAKALIERGVKAYSSAFRARYMGGPSLADRASGAKAGNIAKSQITDNTAQRLNAAASLGFGFDEHFNVIEESSYLSNHRALYNPHLGVVFNLGYCCCNLVPIELIPKRFADAFEAAKKSGNELFGAASHEQYSFPYYHNYIPDHMERIECAIRCLVEGGCTPVFYSDGFMGNMSWE